MEMGTGGWEASDAEGVCDGFILFGGGVSFWGEERDRLRDDRLWRARRTAMGGCRGWMRVDLLTGGCAVSCDAWVKNSAQQITNEEKLMSDGGCETAIGFRRFATGVGEVIGGCHQWMACRTRRVWPSATTPTGVMYLPFL